MEILPLSYTFRSAGLINLEVIRSKDKEMSSGVDEAFGSLSIDMVEVERSKTGGTGLPPFLRGQTLDN